MFVANRTRNTATRVEKDVRDEMEGEGEIDPTVKIATSLAGTRTCTPPFPLPRQPSPPHMALPQPAPVQGQQNIEPISPINPFPR